MRVTRVELRGVTTHTNTDLGIPETGVTLLTGSNGSGKSTVLDALPLVLWGRTLRGKSVWSASTAEVSVTLDGVRYTRTQRGQTSRLTWPGAPVFESTKHALAHLAELHGPMSRWASSCVLSSSDAERFTGASDTARKAVLEEILQLHRYERAHETLRATAKATRATVDGTARLLAQATERHTRAATRLAETRTPPRVPRRPVHPGPAPEKPDLSGELADLGVQLDQAQREHRAAQVAVRPLADRVAVLRERRARLDRSQCASCGQDIPGALRDDVSAELSGALADLDAAQETARALEGRVSELSAQRSQVAQRARAAQDAARAHQVALSAYTRELEHYRAAVELAEQLETQRAAAQAELEAAQAELDQAKEAHRAAQDDLDHQLAAVEITGPQGYRATQLAGALSTLEELANGWLVQLDTDIRLEIRATGTRADGSPTARIALGVRGAGGGHYQGCSGGERRRIDVAVMLGLAQLADLGRTGPPSTLWADEAFDALDAPGREALAGLLGGLSADRGVVVVTHTAQEEIAQVARVRYVVRGGRVSPG